MKLSELFKTPFRVKGGGVLNLNGFSKRVVDKEIEDGNIDAKFPIGEKILNFFGEGLIAHPSKFALDPENSDAIMDINDFDEESEPFVVNFLYKKSDIDAFPESTRIIYMLNYVIDGISYTAAFKEDLNKKVYTIDNVAYYALYDVA